MRGVILSRARNDMKNRVSFTVEDDRGVGALWGVVLIACVAVFLFSAESMGLVTTGTLGVSADIVVGQPDFARADTGTTSNSFNRPIYAAFDSKDRLYISDLDNNRVLIFDNPFFGDTTADTIIGQSDFVTKTPNTGGRTASTLNQPHGMTFDAQGRFYLADQANNRILIYDDPAANDTAADTVLGQVVFTTADTGTTSNNLISPTDVKVTTTGQIFVVDSGNNRIVVFHDQLDTFADTVLGQPDFVRNSAGVNANAFSSPIAITLDASNNLWVADYSNHRALFLHDPRSGDTTADSVLGQPDFSTGNANSGGLSANSLQFPAGLALDSTGRLLVADYGNNRALIYYSLTSLDTSAGSVIGQTSLTASSANAGGRSAFSLATPTSLLLDSSSRVILVDQDNHRVLRYAETTPVVVVLASVATLPVSVVVNPTDTNSTVNAPVATSESFVQINLDGGGTTVVLSTAADSAGTGANYSETTTLVNANDTVQIFVWTNQETASLLIGLRSDTENIQGNFLPRGLLNNDAGRRALGATILMTEFADASGQLIGDSVTTSNIGDTFTYTLVYSLSQATADYYGAMGFDTKAGSKSFAFYYADTYGGKWIVDFDPTVIVGGDQWRNHC